MIDIERYQRAIQWQGTMKRIVPPRGMTWNTATAVSMGGRMFVPDLETYMDNIYAATDCAGKLSSNCKNCGAPLKTTACEYCRTQYQ